MTMIEIRALLGFLERTRVPAVTALGIVAQDPVWSMVLALMRRHYEGKRITVTALAQASGSPHATALRQLAGLEVAGLVKRQASKTNRRLTYVLPTARMIDRFLTYCARLKEEIVGLSGAEERMSPVRLNPQPLRMNPPMRSSGPLRLLLSDDPSFLALAMARSEIESAVAGQVETEIVSYDPLYRELMENARRPVSAYDLIAIDMPWVGRLAHDGALHGLERELEESKIDIFDFYATAWAGGQYHGRQYGLPFAPTSELLLYRSDAFAAAGLSAPTTVSEVLAAARALQDPARDTWGVAWNAACGQPLGQTFVQMMGAFGSPPVSLRSSGEEFSINFEDCDLRPLFRSTAAQATLEYLRALVEVSPPEIAEMDWRKRMACYRAGRVMMSYEWSSRAAPLEWDTQSPARAKTGYLPYPAGPGGRPVSPMGGFVIGIPSNLPPDRIKRAWRLLRWLVAPEMTKHLIRTGSMVNLRYSVSKDPEVRRLGPVLERLDAMARLGQVKLWPRPPLPQITEILQIAGEELHPAIFGDVPAEKALARLDDRVAILLGAT